MIARPSYSAASSSMIGPTRVSGFGLYHDGVYPVGPGRIDGIGVYRRGRKAEDLLCHYYAVAETGDGDGRDL